MEDYTLTALDIAALRKADDICVHLTERHPSGLIRVIKRAEKTTKNPFAQDVEHIIAAPVEIDVFNAAPEIASGKAKCFALVSLYHSQKTPASMIVNSLRAGDVVRFVFRPDHHTNGYLARVKLHADVLCLMVWRNGKRVEHTLHASIAPENSARMCAGVPCRNSYVKENWGLGIDW